MNGLRKVLVLALLAAACAGDVPASLLLTISTEDSAPAPDSVRVRAFDDDGQAHAFVTFAAPAPGPAGRLGTVVIYPRRNHGSGLRIEAQGLDAEVVVSAGSVQAAATGGRQTEATVQLLALPSADRDGDGVPDAVDNCPRAANHGQDDGDGDGVGDACGTVDAGPDGQGDGAQLDDALPSSNRALGTTCSSGTQCASGSCVDDVCCEGTCTDACRTCNLPGRAGQCAPVPAGEADPHGACTAEAATTCGFDGRCNGAGGCRRHPAGTECRPGNCAGTADRLLPGTCDGNGLCAESRMQSCAPYLCANGACKETCSVAADCAPGAACSNNSCGRKPLGAACTTGTDCNAGNCIDGVCCDVAACAGPCRACNLPGAVGTCQNLPAAIPPRPAEACGTFRCAGGACATTCTSDEGCAASTICNGTACVPRAANGADCTSGRACASGQCVDGHCCQSASCGYRQACTGAGGTCVGRRTLGNDCDSNGDCASGFCTDGVCCENACSTPCRRCDGAQAGRCELMTSGRDYDASPTCAAPKRCTDGGVCR